MSIKTLRDWLPAIIAVVAVVAGYVKIQADVDALKQAVNIERIEKSAAWRATTDNRLGSVERQVRCQWKRIAGENC